VTGQPSDPVGDIAANVQRWLIRSGAENMRRELGDQFRKAFGGGRAGKEDVWSTATTEPPRTASDEAPECAWCPVCRTARRIRESGPGLGGGIAGAGDAVAAAVQEALSAFDAFLSTRPGAPQPTRPAPRSPGEATERPGHEPDGRG
jgi:hypothetical protein